MPRSANDLEAEIEGLQGRLAQLYAELEGAPIYPKEPKGGSVVKFQVQFDPNGTVYQYAAYRIGDNWYTTGSMGFRRRTWQDVVTLMRRDVRFQNDLRAKLVYQVSEKWKTVEV